MLLSFMARIEIVGANPYVSVSVEQAERLKADWRKPMPVLVQVNGEPKPPWRINMMPRGDASFYLYLAGMVRKASGTKVGDTVQVEVEFDEDYRGGPTDMPEWFAEALESDDVAMTSWLALSPSRQKEVARYLANLKSDEARARNLAKAMEMLGGKAGRFIARDWKDGK